MLVCRSCSVFNGEGVDIDARGLYVDLVAGFDDDESSTFIAPTKWSIKSGAIVGRLPS